MKIDGNNDFVMNQTALTNFGGKVSGAFFIVGAGKKFDVRSSANTRLLRVMESSGFIGMGLDNPLFNLHLANGNAAKPGGGMWATTSDANSKQNVSPYTKGLDVLLKLKPVSYQYNGRFGTPNDGKTYEGLIAQEVMKIIPTMVEEKTYQEIQTTYSDETGTVEEVVSEEQFLTVDPSELTYVLINAVKELHNEVEN